MDLGGSGPLPATPYLYRTSRSVRPQRRSSPTSGYHPRQVSPGPSDRKTQNPTLTRTTTTRRGRNTPSLPLPCPLTLRVNRVLLRVQETSDQIRNGPVPPVRPPGVPEYPEPRDGIVYVSDPEPPPSPGLAPSPVLDRLVSCAQEKEPVDGVRTRRLSIRRTPKDSSTLFLWGTTSPRGTPGGERDRRGEGLKRNLLRCVCHDRGGRDWTRPGHPRPPG